MLKLISKLNASVAKLFDKAEQDQNSDYIYMTFNDGDFLPIVIPLKSKIDCIEGTSCDLFR